MAKNDDYNFDLKCIPQDFHRDIGTIFGIRLNGFGKEFTIYIEGTTTLNQ
jgi:hypothetical protein